MKFFATGFLLVLITGTVAAQSITKKDTIHFVEAVKLLEQQYQVRFAFDHQLLGEVKVPTWDSSDDLDQILGRIFEPLDLLYERSDRTVLVIPKTEYVLQNIALSGVIVDESTGESLPNAAVYLTSSGKYTVTNREGRFSFLNVPSDTSIIEVRYLGYTPRKFVARQLSEQQNAVIALSDEASILNEVTVSEMKENVFEISQQASKISVDMESFKSMANFGEPDVFRSVQLLPGISGTNETSSGLNIRGGAPEQNLILFDGFTVYHLDHFFGIFSAFNSNVIKDVQLYKGGYGAEYGTRVSGVMDITGKSGNTYKPSGNIGVNMISSNAAIEIPITKKLSWLVAGRRSYTDVIESGLYKKLFDHVRDNDPGSVSNSGEGQELEALEPNFYFYDVNTKLSYRVDDKNLITFSYYDGKDNLNLEDSDVFGERTDFVDGSFIEQRQSYKYEEVSTWGNRGGSLKFGRQWDDRLFTEVKLVSSRFFRDQQIEETVDYYFSTTSDSIVFDPNTGSFNLVKRDTLVFEELFESKFGSKNRVNESAVYVTSEYKTSDRNLFSLGLFAIRNSIRYSTFESGIEFEDVLSDSRGYTMGLFGQNTLQFNDHGSSLTGGARLSRYSVNDKLYFEPRISVSHQLNDEINLKAAFGTYYQFAVNTTINGPSASQSSFWALADGSEVPILKSNHYIAGVTYRKNNFTVDLEGYYRTIDGLTNVTINPFFSDSEDGQGAFLGDGRGYGLEFLVKKQFGSYNTWLSYTLSRTEHQFDGINDGNYFDADQDQRHEVKSVHQLKLGRFDLSATWIYGSGRPYSSADSVNYFIDENLEFYFPSVNLTSKNTLRLRAYHRLDLSVAYNADLVTSQLTFGLNLLNVYGRMNVRGFRNILDFDVQDQSRTIQKPIRLLGFTPSVFINFTF